MNPRSFAQQQQKTLFLPPPIPFIKYLWEVARKVFEAKKKRGQRVINCQSIEREGVSKNKGKSLSQVRRDKNVKLLNKENYSINFPAQRFFFLMKHRKNPFNFSFFFHNCKLYFPPPPPPPPPSL